MHKQPSTLPSFAYFSLHSVRWTFPGDSSESELDLLDAAPRHNIVDPTTAAAAAYKPWMSESKHVYTCNLATLITPVSMDHAWWPNVTNKFGKIPIKWLFFAKYQSSNFWEMWPSLGLYWTHTVPPHWIVSYKDIIPIISKNYMGHHQTLYSKHNLVLFGFWS